MAEPPELLAVRKHLGEAEAAYGSAEGLRHLEEGLALLEEVMLDGGTEHRAVAANLLSTYSKKICDAIRKRVEQDPALPEPQLEHLFKALRAFDAASVELPDYVRSLKIEVVRRLIDRYYEGYPEADKQQALRQLAGIADD